MVPTGAPSVLWLLAALHCSPCCGAPVQFVGFSQNHDMTTLEALAAGEYVVGRKGSTAAAGPFACRCDNTQPWGAAGKPARCVAQRYYFVQGELSLSKRPVHHPGGFAFCKLVATNHRGKTTTTPLSFLNTFGGRAATSGFLRKRAVARPKDNLPALPYQNNQALLADVFWRALPVGEKQLFCWQGGALVPVPSPADGAYPTEQDKSCFKRQETAAGPSSAYTAVSDVAFYSLLLGLPRRFSISVVASTLNTVA